MKGDSQDIPSQNNPQNNNRNYQSQQTNQTQTKTNVLFQQTTPSQPRYTNQNQTQQTLLPQQSIQQSQPPQFTQPNNSIFNNNSILNTLNSANPLKQELLSYDSSYRSSAIIQNINQRTTEISLDPIMSVFKSSPYLHSSFLKRFFELIKVSLAEERENYVSELLKTVEVLRESISDNESKISDLESRESFLKSTLEETLASYDSDVKEKDEHISVLEEELAKVKESNSENQKSVVGLKEAGIGLRKDMENAINDNNEMMNNIGFLKEKLSETLEENKALTKKVYEKEAEAKVFKEEFDKREEAQKSKEDQLGSLQEKINLLDKAVGEKDGLIKELVQKFEEIKEECEMAKDEYERTLQELKEKNNYIFNDLKPKNKALKAKLLEKIALMESMDKQFLEYRKSKEAYIKQMMNNNKQMSDERNLILNELVHTNLNNNNPELKEMKPLEYRRFTPDILSYSNHHDVNFSLSDRVGVTEVEEVNIVNDEEDEEHYDYKGSAYGQINQDKVWNQEPMRYSEEPDIRNEGFEHNDNSNRNRNNKNNLYYQDQYSDKRKVNSKSKEKNQTQKTGTNIKNEKESNQYRRNSHEKNIRSNNTNTQNIRNKEQGAKPVNPQRNIHTNTNTSNQYYDKRNPQFSNHILNDNCKDK